MDEYEERGRVSLHSKRYQVVRIKLIDDTRFVILRVLELRVR